MWLTKPSPIQGVSRCGLGGLASPSHFPLSFLLSGSGEGVLARLLTQFASTRPLTLDRCSGPSSSPLRGRDCCVDLYTPIGLEYLCQGWLSHWAVCPTRWRACWGGRLCLSRHPWDSSRWTRMSSGSAPEIRSVGVIVELVTPVFWQARRIRMERAGRFCIWCKVRFTELCAERSSLVGRPHLSRRPGRRVPSWSSFCRWGNQHRRSFTRHRTSTWQGLNANSLWTLPILPFFGIVGPLRFS